MNGALTVVSGLDAFRILHTRCVNIDAELVAPYMPAHIQGVGTDMVIIQDLMMPDVPEETPFQPAPIFRFAFKNRVGHKIAIKGPGLHDKRRSGSGFAIIHIRPHPFALPHDRQCGNFCLTYGQVSQIGNLFLGQ